MARTKVKWSTPKNKFERIGLILTGITGVLMFILANKLFVFGINYEVSWVASLTTKAINLFWISLIMFHIGLMILITRSVLIGGTSTNIDYTVGLFAVIGVFMVIASTIAGIYFGKDIVPWFFNLRQPVMFGLGFITEAIALMYFAFTE
jgi:hypothetical protein